MISPSDVGAERDAVASIIAAWNAQIGLALGARIEAVRWELHSTPSLMGPAQEVINEQLVEDCDLGVALFSARLGTPTAEHESGSVEEIYRLKARGAPVLVYFASGPLPRSADLKEYARLQVIRERFQAEGLLSSFDSVADLRELLLLHLTAVVSRLRLTVRAEAGDVVATTRLIAPLPDIRVVVQAGTTWGPRGTFAILQVGVQNHSGSDFFYQSIFLEFSNGNLGTIFQDQLTMQPVQGERIIRPGDSFTVNFDGPRLLREVDVTQLVGVRVVDKIGRAFRASEDDLRRALTRLAKEIRPTSG